jgi:poly-gamma-glutamate synthesis protein (capsule biosynthesis protein)
MGDKTKPGTGIRILIGGDMVPTGRAADDFQQGRVRRIWGDFIDDFSAANLVIGNLECPLTDTEAPISKVGRNFIAPTASINGIEKAGFGLLSLANNHIMDQGGQGLASTLTTCTEHGIETVGAGDNVERASRVWRKQIGQVDIAVHSAAEREFSIADTSRPGANPISPIDLWRNHRTDPPGAFSICLLHAGREHYPYPSPKLQKLCRFCVDQGARVVLCQHSHCAGTFEEYGDGLIVYGQGNLAFDKYPKAQQSWHEGFLVALDIQPGPTFTYAFLPFVQYREKASVGKLDPAPSRTLIDAMEERSTVLRDEDQVRRLWEDHCQAHRDKYFSILRGHGGLWKKANKHLHLTNLVYRKYPLLYALNTVRCETHNEILETILEMENR